MAMLVYQRVIPMLLRSMFHLKMERSKGKCLPIHGSDQTRNGTQHNIGTCPADVFPHAGIILWFGDVFQVDLAIPGKLISSPTTKDTTIDAVAWSHKNWFNYKGNSAYYWKMASQSGAYWRNVKEMSHTPGIAVSSPTIDASIANCMAERAPT